MSATSDIPAEDRITVEINDQPYPARKGQMIIEITDANDIEVPRFCYHSKLPVAANCRMCLVQVEKAPKPLPACATPAMDGMKVWTHSDYARQAQKAVMEFLLINHPLDCPICDQGGECELQDIALEYGKDVSRFVENKRVVKDKNLGSLIATDMTRCIHCTRCIRFLENIAGYKELGGMGRGENVEISTYVEHAIGSELSGNIIDVCPVGALTSKPFRFRARAWELIQHPTVAAHDCVGSHQFLHSRRGEVLRAVPRDNEAINEVWLSDRDRYGYQGFHHPQRLLEPAVKTAQGWQALDWEEALQEATAQIGDKARPAGEELGILVSPSATLEEMTLLNRLAEGLGCHNIDYRLRQSDFADQDSLPVYPWLGQSVAELEQAEAVLLIGSNIRKEQPILGHRVRKAALQGAKVMALNMMDYPFHFELSSKLIAKPSRLVGQLAALARAVAEKTGQSLPAELAALALEGTDTHRAMAETLLAADAGVLLLGLAGAMHPQASAVRNLSAWLAGQTGSRLGYLSDGANAAGACLAGAQPHRGVAGAARDQAGLTAGGMVAEPRKLYLLFGCEPDSDFANPAQARAALGEALVIACSAYDSPALREVADILLPITPVSETSGTFVNIEGTWQSFAGSVAPAGEARPGWKVLRVLGNLLDLDGFDATASHEIRDELREQASAVRPDHAWRPAVLSEATESADLERIGEVPMYRVDAVVRRAEALQNAVDGGGPCVRIHPADLPAQDLSQASQVKLSQGDAEVTLPFMADERVPEGAVWIPGGFTETAVLGESFGPVRLSWV